MLPKIVSVSELKGQAASLLNELQQSARPLFVTVHGRPRAVMLSYADYEEMLNRSNPTETAAAEVPLTHYGKKVPRVEKGMPRPRVVSAKKYPAFARVWDNDDDDRFDAIFRR